MINACGELSEIELDRRETLRQTRPHIYKKVIRFADKVKQGKSVALIQLQYDYRCNFRCEHCCTSKMEKPNARFLRLEDVKNVAEQADEIGLSHFTITGGEPLIFKDLDKLVEAINPNKFWVAMDSNAWFLDEDKAMHLRSIGISKVHLSLDSVHPFEHDLFRRRPGSHARVLRGIEAAKKAGLMVLVNTIMTKQRAWSQEFVEFLEFTKELGVSVVLMLAKPNGEWEGNDSVLLDENDLAHVREFESRYDVFTHLTPMYGLDVGCIAVKRMVSLTRYGDIMPCPWIHTSLGNVFKEPLKDILERGMKIKWFGEKQNTCIGSVKGPFLNKHVGRIRGRDCPVPWTQVFGAEDFIK
jgi:MoaA/NifB/PqqE/SkfB family radical SAM enzyme